MLNIPRTIYDNIGGFSVLHSTVLSLITVLNICDVLKRILIRYRVFHFEADLVPDQHLKGLGGEGPPLPLGLRLSLPQCDAAAGYCRRCPRC